MVTDLINAPSTAPIAISSAEVARVRELGPTVVIGPGLLGRALARVIKTAGGMAALLERALPPRLAPRIPDGIETVILCAHPRDHHAKTLTPALYEDTVAVTAAVMLEAAERGVKRCAVVSSGAVYAPSDRPCREDDPLIGAEASPYASAKLAAENVAAVWRGQFRSLAIYRPYFMYGPEASPIQLMRSLTRRIRMGDAIDLAGERGVALTPTYVDDAVRALVWTLADNHSFVVFNLTGPSLVDLQEICEHIGRLTGYPVKFQRRLGVSPVIAGSAEQLASAGCPPRIGIEQGLAESIKHWPA